MQNVRVPYKTQLNITGIKQLGKFKKKCDQSVTLGVKNKNHARAFFLFPYILNLTNFKCLVYRINSFLLSTS